MLIMVNKDTVVMVLFFYAHSQCALSINEKGKFIVIFGVGNSLSVHTSTKNISYFFVKDQRMTR